MKVALVIPTRNGAKDLSRLLKSVSAQTLHCDVIVVDSESMDGTVKVASEFNTVITPIRVSEFNHGGTRQKVVAENSDYDFFVFMTQDAYLADEHALDRLIAPFSDERVGAVCGRQLPHADANLLAGHARLFNYPAESRIKTIKDAPELGIKTAFISNSFAAYRTKALLEVGGFPEDVILSEDMFVAARMLLAGWKIGYSGDAQCHHSHNYSLAQEFHRYFDIGVFHARESWIKTQFGRAGGEGLRYVRSELRFLGLQKAYLWPASLLRNALKLLGYQLGLRESRIPRWLKIRLSMNRRYWQ